MKSLKQRRVFITLLAVAFFFRLGFGLCSEFWTNDEKQIYLTGLKFYTTGEWPYFGPHITDYIQIPGALQGLIVGLPLYLLPIPESPFILLNVLSFASLCLLAWYSIKRLPEIPVWFVWSWLMIAPWTLNFSTHIVNPSYLLPGSILFFVGALETYPQLRKNLIPLSWANLMMGVSLFWVMQFHMSWVVLVPYALVSFYLQYRLGESLLKALSFFTLGAILSGAFLVPTFLKYGLVEGLGGTNHTVQLNPANLLTHLNIVEGVLGRFLSFASFEVPRFLGRNTVKRLEFIKEEVWLVPFILFLFIIGILQPIGLIVMWFSRTHMQSDWKAIKYLTLFTVILLYVIFMFAFRDPAAHTFYVTFPIVILYSMYCWNKLLRNTRWRTLAKIFIVSGIIFQAGFAAHNYSRISLYVNRSIPQAAIDQKDYRILGERRPTARY
ncbi:MAG: hypothetical protein ND866_30875 [Pyrinomonadaceae bacterium]|nr:hypothetical protein [Pyrinomonadaceae bacterium]